MKMLDNPTTTFYPEYNLIFWYDSTVYIEVDPSF